MTYGKEMNIFYGKKKFLVVVLQLFYFFMGGILLISALYLLELDMILIQISSGITAIFMIVLFLFLSQQSKITIYNTGIQIDDLFYGWSQIGSIRRSNKYLFIKHRELLLREITIINSLGKIELARKYDNYYGNIMLDVSSLTKGLHVLLIYTDKRVFYKRFTKL